MRTVDILKEPVITQCFIGWTEKCEKEKHNDSGAVERAIFINKCKDTTFYLPDTGENYWVDEDSIQLLRGCCGSWTIFGNSNKT